MKVSEKEFLRIIAQHFNPDGELSVSKVNLPEIFSLARKHNILPLICNVLFPSCASDELFKREKTAAISCYLAQTVKSAKFLSVYEKLLSLNFRPVCVKGVTLRALYDDGDLRPSGDEDLLISKQEEERFEKAIKGLGFELKRTGINERTYSDPETGLVIEAHTSLFCESGALGETLKTLFEAEEKNTCWTEINGAEVLTLDAQSTILYLVCHAFKHFIRCGFGIRQVCDIAVYLRKYKNCIDFEKLQSDLSKLNAWVFFEGIVNIAREYLAFEDIAFESLDRKVETKELLEDILEAGIFGRGESSRQHSAALTLSAAGKKKRSPLITALFPQRETLAASYPLVARYKWLYPFFALVRIVKYVFSVLFKRETNGTPAQSLKIAKERTELMKKYKII